MIILLYDKIKLMKFIKLKAKDGQSLIEVLIGLAIGAILIGASTLGIVFILRSSTSTQNLQSGSQLTQELVDRMRSVADAAWQDLYGLTKGTSTAYFVAASGTKQIVIEGKEGVLSNEIFDGLVAHWNFDEATSTAITTTFDTSGKANHGTLTNSPSRATTTCKVSYCLDFDGVNDYVVVSNSVSIQGIASKGTIAAWVKLDTLPTGSNLATMVDIDGTGCTARGLFFYISSNQFKLQYGGGGVCRNVNSTTQPPISTWTHVVATWDSSGGKIYVNGVQEGSNASAPDFSIAQASTYIGSQGGTLRFVDGMLDDVRLYNRALSADEIQRLWNSTVFTRYVNVENVNRDSGGNIVSAGGNEDPSTQKITVYVEWPGAGTALGQVKVIDYVTRWANRVFNQTDWSGGGGQTDVITEPNNRYSNATSVSNPAGSIRIEGL